MHTGRHQIENFFKGLGILGQTEDWRGHRDSNRQLTQ